MRPAPYTRGGKAPAIACRAANLRRARFLFLSCKNLHLKRKSPTYRILRGMRKAPAFQRGRGGVNYRVKAARAAAKSLQSAYLSALDKAPAFWAAPFHAFHARNVAGREVQ